MFTVYGHKPVERDSNIGLTSDMQRQAQEVRIYETDDEAEAKRIVASGGYIDNATGQWYVATRYDSFPSGGESEFTRATPLKASSQPLGDAVPEKPVPENSAGILNERTGLMETDISSMPLDQRGVDNIIEAERRIAPIRRPGDGSITGPRTIY